MKILYNSNIFFDQHYGGISRYYFSIFEKLIKKKTEFKVLAPFYKNKYLKSLDKNYKEGIYLSRYPTLKILRILNESLSIRLINNKSYDIIHDTFYSNNLLEIRDKKKLSQFTTQLMNNFQTIIIQNKLYKIDKKYLRIQMK